MNIFSLYTELSGNVKNAVATLNVLTGKRYTTSRYMEWQRGQRQPDRDTTNVILKVVVPWAVRNGREKEIQL